MRLRSTAALTLTLALCATPAAVAAATAGERLHDLFAREWEQRLRESPLLATSVGRHEWNDRLSSVAPADHARRAEADRRFLAELEAIPLAELDDEDRVNAEIFRAQLEDGIASFEFGAYEIPINADSGFHIGFARLADRVPLVTAKDYDNYTARLRAFGPYMAQQITNMRAGLARGMSLPRIVLQGYEVSIQSHVVERAADSVFWPPFAELPHTVPASEHERLRREGAAAILEVIVPAYRSFLDFMLDEYIPGTRESLGASELPDGRRYYAQRIRHFTTLPLSAEEIHRIGLEEVARIRSEMDEVIAEVGFSGSFADFLEFLRSDPRFYPTTGEQLLKEASYIAKRMDGALPALFKTLPRLPYGVEPVPDHMAPKYTAGRYVGPPMGSTRPGIYWVNTYALESRPLYNLEALTLHEAVPGHHLQNALARELDALPPFRRFSYLSAFGEGWGLYSEWLGLEAGFYTDPYSNFGRLTYEMWRACRLVVDTGLHALGWSRQQAMDFLASNTALALHEVRTETDRYISWPAQALAYKIGEIKIKELRRRAEAALGERFDVREFHDAVLLHGSVPLPVLETQIERYIESSR